MNVRPFLRGALWVGGIDLVVLFVAGVLWMMLTTLGDEAGGQGAKGVAMVSVVCFALDLVAIIVLLAIAEITRPNEPSP